MMNLSSANTSSEALPHNKELYSENSTAAPSMMMDFEAPPPVQPPLLALHEPPPNGGLAAWLQVVGGFFCFFNTWGLVNTFGAFQTYYSSELLTHETESNISWIGSIQAFLLLASTLVMGPLCDLGYTKVQLIICSVVSVFGMMMTSLCTEYWQFMLAQGVVVGVGFGGIFIPAVAIPSTYFTTKRAFALGICAAGSSVGGVIYPIIFHELQPRIGFQWTTRVMAFIMLVTLVFAICCLKVRVLATTKRSFLDLPAFVKYPKFTLYNVACLAGFMGLYVPFFYIQQYAVDIAGTNSNLAFYMLPILNAASIFGRIGPGFVADKVGVINTMLVCAFLSGLLAFCWIAIHTTAGLIVFCILYGFCSGTFVSLQGATVAHLVPHMGWMGTWMGMCAFISGIALLVGTPVAGVILGSGWLGLQCFTGGCIAFSTICISATYLLKHSPLDDTKGM